MMHQRSAQVTLVMLLAAACTPERFGWPDVGTRDLAAYRASFTVAAGERFVTSATRRALVERTARVRALWLGDHHRNSLLHGLQLELLRELVATGRPLVLQLEAIGTADEGDVAAFVGGRMDMPELAARMRGRWPGSWLDDADVDSFHYRALLSFARRHTLPVRALEPTPRLPLGERDPWMARAVREAAAAHPDALVVVVVGQSHLLGRGDLIRRVGLPALAIGGQPTPALAAAASERPAPATMLVSDGGLWWFGETLRAGG
jgi:hypothetical protein